jgi:hypothetical protein
MTARRWWVVIVIGLAGTLAMGWGIHNYPGTWSAQTDVLVYPPADQGAGAPLGGPAPAIKMTAVVERVVNNGPSGPRVVDSSLTLANTGVEHGERVVLVNSGGQWANDFNRAALHIQTVDTTEDGARSRLASLVQRVVSTIDELQNQAGVLPSGRVAVTVTPAQGSIVFDPGEPTRALAATALLGVGTTGFLVRLLELQRRRREARMTRTSLRTVTGGPQRSSVSTF